MPLAQGQLAAISSSRSGWDPAVVESSRSVWATVASRPGCGRRMPLAAAGDAVRRLLSRTRSLGSWSSIAGRQKKEHWWVLLLEALVGIDVGSALPDSHLRSSDTTLVSAGTSGTIRRIWAVARARRSSRSRPRCRAYARRSAIRARPPVILRGASMSVARAPAVLRSMMITGPPSAAFLALLASWLNWRLDRVVMGIVHPRGPTGPPM